MNLPNFLTTIRIILVPIYLFVFFSEMENRLLISLGIFILAGITDFLDGYIARKNNLVTKLGKVLDPLADKLMMFAVLISLTAANLIPKTIVAILFIKEIIMIIGGGVLYIFKGNQVLPSNIYGKVATVFFYFATLITVIFQKKDISKFLFTLTVILNIIAFLNYFMSYLTMRNRNK